MKTKKCSKCNSRKELIQFYKNKKHKDGLDYACKTCSYLLKRKRYIKNQEERKPKKLDNIPIHIEIHSIDNYIKLDNICGVYTFINDNNKVVYIGSSCNIKRRIREHILELNKSSKRCNKKLLELWNNKSITKIGLLQKCNSSLEAEKKEQYYIKKWPTKLLTNAWSQYNIDNISEKHIKSFWKKVNIKNKNQCWEWKGCLKRGYGYVKIQGICYRVHRISYHISNPNEDLSGIIIRHVCDNKKCVNPEHLTTGSQQDNVKDIYKEKI